ncbi:MAG: hypothetical protein A2Y92_04210 [Chloroflexi bacterium RBG_13_57_8]|nr:MAG: hypothetical protein A2Y92_04210 [Chloroflexi bacterium RBG_13_57_8]
MFCAKCGAPLEEGAKFCPKCGTPVAATGAPPAAVAPGATAPPTAPPQAGVRTNGFAVTSLVLGIVGIFLNFLSILAIIFGGIALSQLNKTPGVKGKGLAIAGLVLGIIVVVLWIAVIVWVGSAFWWLFT